MYRDALRAWTEYVPARPRLGEGPLHEAFRLYRGFRAGDLAELFVTDQRLYREGPPCDRSEAPFALDCPERTRPDRSMLGEAQKAWLVQGLQRSPAVWKVWANEVLMMQLRATLGYVALDAYNMDAWDGFPGEREAVLGAVRDAGVENLVVLSGDMHACLAGYLLDAYRDPPQEGRRVGVEFMTPSISSGHFRDRLEQDQPGLEARLTEAGVRVANPHFVFFDGQQYGYGILELTPEAATFTLMAVDKQEDRSDPTTRVLRAFRVTPGSLDLEDVTPRASPGRSGAPRVPREPPAAATAAATR